MFLYGGQRENEKNIRADSAEVNAGLPKNR